MKLFLASLLAIVLAATAVNAAPTSDAGNEPFREAVVEKMLVRRDQDPFLDCNMCAENLDVCLKYGFGPSKNIEHCADICSAFMCRKFPKVSITTRCHFGFEPNKKTE
ncbi:unnamed protein product [Periconia digitata]|uniref:Uncharacterized protein n=1 Tax=Periconia digitata TaxID=1303443 RepID=A0A9W4XMN1_9PLEO|nr:unnamed protein product [Periconia digitata]